MATTARRSIRSDSHPSGHWSKSPPIFTATYTMTAFWKASSSGPKARAKRGALHSSAHFFHSLAGRLRLRASRKIGGTALTPTHSFRGEQVNGKSSENAHLRDQYVSQSIWILRFPAGANSGLCRQRFRKAVEK